MTDSKCNTCEYKGYSQELCKFHLKKMSVEPAQTCDHYKVKRITKNAVIGAGIGVMTVAAGIAAAPMIGLKTAIGHLFAVKASAGAGAVGAGAGIGISQKGNHNTNVPVCRPKRRILMHY
jgi:hypothetical protein